MKKPKTILPFLATSLIAWMIFEQPTRAVTIDGTIGFAGFGSITTGATNTVSFYNPVQISYASGAYSGAPPLFTQAAFNPISYVGSGGSATLTAPVAPLWSFNSGSTSYSFNLNSLSYADISSYSGLYSFSMMGYGTANITGYDATLGNFVIGGSGQNLSFQFISGSGTANGTAVPDSGSTVALLGFALITVGALSRRIGIAAATWKN
jgi:VPDSG-CTERM motif